MADADHSNVNGCLVTDPDKKFQQPDCSSVSRSRRYSIPDKEGVDVQTWFSLADVVARFRGPAFPLNVC